MSVGLTGPVGFGVTPANIAGVAVGSAAAAAGTSLAQANGPDAALAHQDVFVQQRSLEAAQQTEDAQGIGQTDGEDNRSNERDADGRTPWMLPRHTPAEPEAVADDAGEQDLPAEISGAGDEPGSHLDLSG